jgi:hypothetical protein
MRGVKRILMAWEGQLTETNRDLLLYEAERELPDKRERSTWFTHTAGCDDRIYLKCIKATTG